MPRGAISMRAAGTSGDAIQYFRYGDASLALHYTEDV